MTHRSVLKTQSWGRGSGACAGGCIGDSASSDVGSLCDGRTSAAKRVTCSCPSPLGAQLCSPALGTRRGETSGHRRGPWSLGSASSPPTPAPRTSQEPSGEQSGRNTNGANERWTPCPYFTLSHWAPGGNIWSVKAATRLGCDRGNPPAQQRPQAARHGEWRLRDWRVLPQPLSKQRLKTVSPQPCPLLPALS